MSAEHELLELRRLMPWLVNGTLDEADNRRLRAALTTHPALAAEIRWLRSLRGEVKAAVDTTPFDPERPLAALRAQISAQRDGKLRSIGRTAPPTWSRVGLALAASLIVAQFAVIAYLVGPARDAYGPLAASPRAEGDLVQVVFRANTTEAQMRAALQSVQGDIVAGPRLLGVYTLRLPAGTQQAAAAQLRANPQVESATPLERR